MDSKALYDYFDEFRDDYGLTNHEVVVRLNRQLISDHDNEIAELICALMEPLTINCTRRQKRKAIITTAAYLFAEITDDTFSIEDIIKEFKNKYTEITSLL